MDETPTNKVRRLLTHMGTVLARPSAFLIVAAYGVAWYIVSPDTLEWHGYATLATWFVTLFIQRSEYRDTQALHAKLDELLHAQAEARSALTRIDNEEPEVIEAHRNDARRND